MGVEEREVDLTVVTRNGSGRTGVFFCGVANNAKMAKKMNGTRVVVKGPTF